MRIRNFFKRHAAAKASGASARFPDGPQDSLIHCDDYHREGLLETFRIVEVYRGGSGGAWVSGSIGGHVFSALAFPKHALKPGWELEDSRISKLCVQRSSDFKTVVNFDRGWEVRPTTNLEGVVVGLLVAGLAEVIYEQSIGGPQIRFVEPMYLVRGSDLWKSIQSSERTSTFETYAAAGVESPARWKG